MQREAYEQLATLDRDHWWFRARRTVYLGLLDRALNGRRVSRALDLGCGAGGFLPGLSARCERVVAADFDFESLSALSSADSNACARVLTGAQKLPFRDGSFDLVTLYDVLEHLDDDQGALREIQRVLAPGGWLALSVPAYPWLFSNNDRVAMHRRRYTRAALARVVDAAGFELVRNTHTNVLLAPLIVPIVLFAKVVESTLLRNRTSAHTNLSWPLPRFAHALLERVFTSELVYTRRFDAPFGHSIALLARRV